MLILSRKVNQKVVLDFSRVIELIDSDPEAAKAALHRVNVVVAARRGDKTRLGLDADKLISVHRAEIQEKVDAATA